MESMNELVQLYKNLKAEQDSLLMSRIMLIGRRYISNQDEVIKGMDEIISKIEIEMLRVELKMLIVEIQNNPTKNKEKYIDSLEKVMNILHTL